MCPICITNEAVKLREFDGLQRLDYSYWWTWNHEKAVNECSVILVLLKYCCIFILFKISYII